MKTCRSVLLSLLAVTLLLCQSTALSVPTVESEQLPDGVSARFTFGNSVYEISSFLLNWHQAGFQCHSKNMTLVSIETKEENDAIVAQISSYSNTVFWTSGNDLYVEGQFYWDSTGSAFGPFYDWNTGEPNNNFDGEDCVQYYTNFKWNDKDFSVSSRFICEKPIS